MGGSGLSGIAIANDRGSAFAPQDGGRRTFYIANAITNRIQIATRPVAASGASSQRAHPLHRCRI
jgi:hypothetical protein